MFLSIIVPHYNLPRELLERCLDSIASQDISSEELETIVVDDGSEESPEWIKERYSGITLINTAHGGLGNARNTGMEHARGEYIQFIDSDDYLEPGSLKRCLETLKAERAQILRFKFRRTDGKRSCRRTKNRYTTSGAAFMASNNLPACAWSYIFSRRLADKHNIRFQCGVYHEDEEFTTKLHFHATSLIDSSITAYNYHIRPGSIIQSRDSKTKEKRIDDILSILEKIKEFRDEAYPTANPLQQSGIDRKIATLTVDTILNLLYMGKTAAETREICDTRLRDAGLFPLPDRNYSLKYRMFRTIANSKAGIILLRILIRKR